ncbi:hypothetical protein DQ04_00431130 [Trypanosoma grayi]|uniref:hypothetical protein n=1 Tax=Trypanosoma grayi TaxID=71804 RepID=UPI0004F456FF|nr:hypothetical protein DQ04_00431130 [Trypanosoma grayi]KEG14509.1 hypothetical protein DQ04_00431130 [Trypanosoma grayi]
MINKAVALPIAEDVDNARSLAVKGDRGAAVYAAHERLEEDLAKLSAVIADTKRYTSSGMDPWAAVSSTIGSICQEVELCLQLFSTGVRMERSRGLRTVTILYDSRKCPADRLRGFFHVVLAAFIVDDFAAVMPATVVLKFAQAVRVFDAQQAAEWLRLGIQGMLDAHNASESSDLPSFSEKLRSLSAFGGCSSASAHTQPKGTNSVMVSMLTLLVKCEAETGGTSTEVQERKWDLRDFVEEDVLESLLRFEVECTAMMKGKKERIRQRIEQRGTKRQVAVPPPVSAPETTDSKVVSRNGGTSRFELLHRYVEYFLGTEWKQHPSRAVVAVAALIIICILLRRVTSVVVAGWGSIRRSSYGARRTLTL